MSTGSAENGAAARARRRAPRRTAAALAGLAGLVVVTTASMWPGDGERYAVDCLAVGAYVAEEGSGPPLAAFEEADRRMGPLTVRRSFDPHLPADFASSSGGADAAAGVVSFVSWKPPNWDHAGAAAGRYDAQIAAWARSVPRTGVYATVFHEPENDMTGPEFVALQRHVHDVVERANPTIQWGPVYMAYWWNPGEPSHYVGDPAGWWPGEEYADFVGFDWYGEDPEPMTGTPEFRHWWRTMRPTGLPLFITEYGQYVVPEGADPDPAQQRRRAQAIAADAAWIADHPRIRMWMYWQGPGHQGDWRLTDEASLRAWRAVAADGCAAPRP